MASSNSSINELEGLLSELLETSDKVIAYIPPDPLKPTAPAKDEVEVMRRRLRQSRINLEDQKLPKPPQAGPIVSKEYQSNLEDLKKTFPWIKEVYRAQYIGCSGTVIETHHLDIHTRDRTHKAPFGHFRVQIIDGLAPNNLIIHRMNETGDPLSPIHPHLNAKGGVCLGTLSGEWFMACQDETIDQQLFLANLFLTTMNDTDFWTDVDEFGFQWEKIADPPKPKKLNKRKPF